MNSLDCADAATTGADSGRAGAVAPPPSLPLELRLDELGISLATLRSALGTKAAFGRLNPADTDEHKSGFSNPPLGKMLGMKLAARIGALLSRPGCAFNNAYLWQYGPGSELHRHIDRAPHDVTMSIPISLDGAGGRWPIFVEDPCGHAMEWSGQPGSALIIDGRWCPHWRAEFQGQRCTALLLHWRAPAVLWPKFLEPIGAGKRGAPLGDEVRDRSTALARLAVPISAPPELQVVDLRAQTLPDSANASKDNVVVVLAPIEDQLALTFDRAEATLAPGDGVAFAARDECRIDWPMGVGKALVGRAGDARRVLSKVDRRGGNAAVAHCPA